MGEKMKQQKYPGFYTAAEARDHLGITEGAFYTYVRSGQLKKEVFPGKRYGLYSIDKVEELVSEIRGHVVNGKSHKIARFTRGTPDDMPETAALIEKIFSTYPNVERWKQWVERNPEIFFLMRTDTSIVGCAFMMPLAKEKIEDILAHEVTPPTTSEEIGLFEPNVPLHLYIRTVGIDPSATRKEKRHWGSRIVANLIKYIVTLGSRGVDIRSITSRSETPDGKRLLRHMGFTEITTTTSSRNFIIDVPTSGIPAIEDYKKALQRWQASHE
jgi:hypothetical protein